MDQSKNNNQFFQNVFYVLIYVFILFVTIFIIREIINDRNININRYIKSIGIVGYELDKPFSENEYYYNVLVDKNEVEVICDTDYETKGCGEIINLDGKKDYQHEIVLMAENKETKYILNIQKDQYLINYSQTTNKDGLSINNESSNSNEGLLSLEENSSKKIKITSINGNPDKWTNKDVKIKVNAEAANGIDSYSFDGGITWQKEDYKIISSNTILKVMVKDKLGISSSSKEVRITKIDKEKPTVQLIKSSATNKEIVLSISASDSLSGVELVSFNNGLYSKKQTYTVRKAGTYSVKVKDRAGNISETATINVQKSDFAENRGETKKTFTVTLVSNGATISQKSASCTTTGSSCEVNLPTITRSGYNVLGWGTRADSKSVLYKSGEKVTVSKNQTLYAITYKLFTATFISNGASSISANNLSCMAYNNNTSCSVKMPNITRSGGSVIGWNRTSNATRPNMIVGETLTLKSNVTYYAITYKALKATFVRDTKETDNVVTLSKKSEECILYNSNKSCNVTLPNVTARGKTIMGIYKTGQNRSDPPYTPMSTVSISSNTTFYARTGTVRGSGIIRNPYATTTITGIKNAPNKTIVIEYDKECSSTLESYKTALRTINSKAPYLFRINKIFLLNNTNYAKTNQDSPNSVGMQHGIPQGQAIDIKCQSFSDYASRESTLVHELAHAMDGYYVLQNSSKSLMNASFNSLYTKYKNTSKFSDYSKTSTLEFFAEIYRHYYYTYLSSNNSGYRISNYPNDVKSKLESYINIAKTKW